MNSKDPIEELFQRNQTGLDESPRAEIWSRIETQLEAQQERTRGIVLWWKYAAAAIVVAGMSFGIWSINESQKQKVTPAVVNVELQPQQEPIPVFDGKSPTEILDEIETQDKIAFEQPKISSKTTNPIPKEDFKKVQETSIVTMDQEEISLETTKPAAAYAPKMRVKEKIASPNLIVKLQEKELNFTMEQINDSTWNFNSTENNSQKVQVQIVNDEFYFQFENFSELTENDKELMKNSIQEYFNSN